MKILGRCLVAVLAMASGACPGGQAGPLDAGSAPDVSSNRITGTVETTINRNVDILFLVDDSSSMRLAQANLERSFPLFLSRLQDPPGLPNIHLAVVSSDMGAGDGSIAGCDSTGGKNGIFQFTARGTCTATNLQPGATFISDVAGVRNYNGALEDVFACIAALGETGCGFEHQFAAILRALGADGRPTPTENQGFLRPDARLAIVMLTNEDDCSASPGVPLFDTGSNTNLASQLGPPTNFRCNEFGHRCGGTMPRRFATGSDVMATMPYSNCTSNDSDGYLLSVTDTANRLKALKSDPSQVAVVSIQGPTTPYTVTWKAPSTADTSCGAASCPWPVIAHSCMASDGSFADPGVRTAQLADQFGATGLVLPFCADSYAPSLDRAAMLINSFLGPPCLTSLFAPDRQNPLLPDCNVVERIPNTNGTTTEKAIPACAENAGVAPCWQLSPGSGTCLGGRFFQVSADPGVPANVAVTFRYDCGRCTSSDPLQGCF
jgi:hypothetical protein